MNSQTLTNPQTIKKSTRPQDSREQAKQLLQQLQDNICLTIRSIS